MAPPGTTTELNAVAGVMAPPEVAAVAAAYRPLMGAAPRVQAHALCAARADAELPSLHGFLWAVVWVVATVLLVALYTVGAS